jgi:cyclopropane fatty-acyl-phospholipid synthase-like methyltransferase
MANPEQARVFILGQHSASLGGGRQLARVFDYTRYKTLVDLAGGSGACSIAAVQKNAGLRAIVVDFPTVLRVADEIIAELGLGDRIQTRAGDIMKDDFPAGDVMLISLIISSYSPEEYTGLLRRVYDKLPSGGAVVIHDFVMNDTKTGPTISALYHLTSIDGLPYSGSEIAGMLREVGFVDPEIKPVIPEYTGMVAARKP